MDALKPCPFCGSGDIEVAYVCGEVCVQCRKCEGQSEWHSSQTRAAAAWNTRAPCPECDRQRERANEAVSRAEFQRTQLDRRFALESELARLLGCEGLEGDEQLRVALERARALVAVLDAALSEWDAYATNDVTHGQINRAMRNLHEALYRAAPKHFTDEPLRVTPECPGCLRLRGFVDSMLECFGSVMPDWIGCVSRSCDPAWLGNEEFHASHRAVLLAKDPEHYGKFGWTETPAVRDSKGRFPYYWPTKEVSNGKA